MTKKRKAFKTSPSIRVPRAAVEKLQESKAQAQAQAQAEEIRRLKEQKHKLIISAAESDSKCTELRIRNTALQASVSAAAHDNAVYVEALRDAVKLIDIMHQRAGKQPLPLLDGAEVKRLEEIRLLSLGV